MLATFHFFINGNKQYTKFLKITVQF